MWNRVGEMGYPWTVPIDHLIGPDDPPRVEMIVDAPSHRFITHLIKFFGKPLCSMLSLIRPRGMEPNALEKSILTMWRSFMYNFA
jgi:hypothetical protein